MRLLLDVCVASRRFHRTLTDLGHDVLSASDTDPHATDEALLALANRERRVLITEDKDFGELIFVRGMDHPCVVRFVNMRVVDRVEALRELIEHHAEAMQQNALIVVTPRRVRIRLGTGRR